MALVSRKSSLLSHALGIASRCITSQRSVFSLRGVYTTVLTPFKPDDEKISYPQFEIMLRHINRYPVAGFALVGFFGEFPSIGFDAKINLIKTARKFLGNDRVIIAGAGMESTGATVDLVHKVADAGADCAMVYAPGIGQDHFDYDGCLKHFETVANKSPIPIVFHHLFTQKNPIPIELITELAPHPKIVGTVETGFDIARIGMICKETADYAIKYGNNFHVITQKAGTILPALSVGASGIISSLSNILPFEICRLVELYEENKWQEAKELQWKLLGPSEACGAHGVSALKAALKHFIGIDAGSVRSPLRNLTEEEIAELKRVFQNSGFFLDNETSEQKA